MVDNNELIQQARECAVCMIGADECHRESCKIDSCADVIDLLADALEAAQKEIERLKNTVDALRGRCKDYQSEEIGIQNEAFFAKQRAEKAEAERDTANKCIYDTETYFNLGANKFAYRTIKQYTHDVMEAKCTES